MLDAGKFSFKKMYTHFFFDLDNTLTPSRRPLKAEHVPLFTALCKQHDVIVVTGGTKEHIEAQVGSDGPYIALAQSGNHAVDKDTTELWREHLSESQVAESLRVIELLKQGFDLTVKDHNDLVDNRGAQIGYSVIGYHEDSAKKDAFDPDFSRRKEMLARFPDAIVQLNTAGIEIFPAGSSGYNFTIIGKDKGVNVARLIALKGWNKADCLYVGDALAPGENDHSVVGVIETKPVGGPDDTFNFIKEMLTR